jgi:hypothetical protein
MLANQFIPCEFKSASFKPPPPTPETADYHISQSNNPEFGETTARSGGGGQKNHDLQR